MSSVGTAPWLGRTEHDTSVPRERGTELKETQVEAALLVT